MTKQELVQAISRKTNVSAADAAKAIDAATEVIMAAVKAGDEVTLRGFGSFRKVHKAAKVVRNIHTGEQFIKDAHNEPAFKVSNEFKKFVL